MNEYGRTWDNEKRYWVYRHREAMEEHLGRKLEPNEHVHHLNGDILDNRIDNLCIVTRAEHMAIHRPSQHRLSIPPVQCSISDCSNAHHAKGLCKTHYRKANPAKHYSKKEQARGWRAL